jgi:hypothetical protein
VRSAIVAWRSQSLLLCLIPCPTVALQTEGRGFTGTPTSTMTGSYWRSQRQRLITDSHRLLESNDALLHRNSQLLGVISSTMK